MAKIYWRGHGVLSGLLAGKNISIRENEEIPAGFLEPARVKQLRKKGRIAGLPKEQEQIANRAAALKKAAIEKADKAAAKAEAGAEAAAKAEADAKAAAEAKAATEAEGKGNKQ